MQRLVPNRQQMTTNETTQARNKVPTAWAAPVQQPLHKAHEQLRA